MNSRNSAGLSKSDRRECLSLHTISKTEGTRAKIPGIGCMVSCRHRSCCDCNVPDSLCPQCYLGGACWQRTPRVQTTTTVIPSSRGESEGGCPPSVRYRKLQITDPPWPEWELRKLQARRDLQSHLWRLRARARALARTREETD